MRYLTDLTDKEMWLMIGLEQLRSVRKNQAEHPSNRELAYRILENIETTAQEAHYDIGCLTENYDTFTDEITDMSIELQLAIVSGDRRKADVLRSLIWVAKEDYASKHPDSQE